MYNVCCLINVLSSDKGSEKGYKSKIKQPILRIYISLFIIVICKTLIKFFSFTSKFTLLKKYMYYVFMKCR